MNYFFSAIKYAFFDFSRNKGRTFLTSLGILIGVLSVVLLMAFGLGLKAYIKGQFESLGTNLLRVVPGKVLQGGGFRAGAGALGGIRFDERDIQKLKRIKDVKSVAPLFTKTVTVTVRKNSQLTDLYTSSADVFLALNVKAKEGVLFTKGDVEKRSKIAVIGPKLAVKLFGLETGALGKNIKIEGHSFKVVGVVEPKGGGFGGPDLDSLIYMPYTTGFVFNADKKFLAIVIQSDSDTNLGQVKSDINTVLLKRYKPDDFSVIEQTEIINAIGSIFNIMNIVLVAIAAISLIVGGIGVMNIMYVTVTERIKEIGIRRALGARKIDILTQFLMESIILSLFGGFLGLLIAFIIVFFIQRIFPAYINAQAILLSLGVSTFIGVVFGVFPAKRAADLSPIEAIRYE